MQIQISWLLQKPTDLDLHCLKRRVHPGSAGQGLNLNSKTQNDGKNSILLPLRALICSKHFTFNELIYNNLVNVVAKIFSNTLIFLLQKLLLAFTTHYFSKNIIVFAIFQDRNFNIMLKF